MTSITGHKRTPRRGPQAEAEPASISIVIADDHPLVRSGLRLMLERESKIRVVAEAGTAAEAVRTARLEKPSLVILDLVMPGGSGLNTIPRILEAAPETKILVLSMENAPSYIREAFAAGASGYLSKDTVDTELLVAVRDVARGRRYLEPRLGAQLAQPNQQPQAPTDTLSARENEVLQLLALGHTNHEIAAILCVSARTAETHRARIMKKLHLSTRAELIRHALTHDILNKPTSP